MAAISVVVVGAGVVGLFCAVRLAERGARVALVERGLPGGENSTATGGGVRQQFGAAINVQMSRLAAPTWETFAKDFKVDPLWRQSGYLFLAHGVGDAETLRAGVELQHRHSVDSEYLLGDEIASRWPFLARRGYVAAAFRQKDGWLNHYRVIDALVRRALDLGVQIELGSEAIGLIGAAGRICGVVTPMQTLAGDAVVLAAGSWASGLLEPLGINLPIVSRRHELVVVSAHQLPERLPWLIDVGAQVHLRPDAPGRALIGGFLGRDDPADPEKFAKRADERWRAEVLKAASAAFGVVEADAVVTSGWAGLYPGTPDRNPIIDRLDEGLYCALGFSGTGLMHAPAAGRLISELVMDGALRSLAAQPVSAQRFAAGEMVAERTGF